MKWAPKTIGNSYVIAMKMESYALKKKLSPEA